MAKLEAARIVSERRRSPPSLKRRRESVNCVDERLIVRCIENELLNAIPSLQIIEELRKLTRRSPVIYKKPQVKICSLVPMRYFAGHAVCWVETALFLRLRTDLSTDEGVLATSAASRAIEISRKSSVRHRNGTSTGNVELHIGSMHFSCVPPVTEVGFEAQSLILLEDISYPLCVAALMLRSSLLLLHSCDRGKTHISKRGCACIEICGMGGNAIHLSLQKVLEVGVFPWMIGAETIVREVEPSVLEVCKTHSLCGTATCLLENAMGPSARPAHIIFLDCFDPCNSSMSHPDAFLRGCKKRLELAVTMRATPVGALVVNTHSRIDNTVNARATLQLFGDVFCGEMDEVHVFPLPRRRQSIVVCLHGGGYPRWCVPMLRCHAAELDGPCASTAMRFGAWATELRTSSVMSPFKNCRMWQ